MKNTKMPIILSFCFCVLFACSGNDSPKEAPIEEEEETQQEFEVLKDIYVTDNSFKVVGYFPNYRYNFVDSIDYSKLTHLFFIKAYPTSNGSIGYDNQSELADAINKAKEQNADIKIAMSFGGGALTDDQIDNWINYLKPENRTHFVNNIVKYAQDNGLNGVDIDLEGNILPKILDNYGVFIRHLKNNLHAVGKFLSVALPASTTHSIAIGTIKEFDFINIMCYGRKDIQKYTAAVNAINFWTGKGIAKEKLVLGVPFFGWTLETTPEAYTFGSIVKKNIDNAYNDNLDINNHNGIPTIMKKFLLAKNSANGIMIWEVGQDSFDDLSLLKAISETQIASTKCADNSIKIYYKDKDQDGYGDKYSPFIDCTAPDNYVDNNLDCNDEDMAIGNCNN